MVKESESEQRQAKHPLDIEENPRVSTIPIFLRSQKDNNIHEQCSINNVKAKINQKDSWTRAITAKD